MKYDNILDFPGYYVSPLGKVYTRIDKQGRLTPRHNKKGTFVKLKWRIVHPRLGTNGYLRIHINRDYHTKSFNIHRLVAKIYVPNPNPDKLNIVLHLNGDRLDNRYTNLKWGTQLENVHQTVREGKNLLGSKYNVEGIIEAKIKGYSSREVSKVFGLSRRYVDIFWKDYRESKGYFEPHKVKERHIRNIKH